MTAGPAQIGITCPRCGSASAPDARFCATCGEGLLAAPAPPAPAASQPVPPLPPGAAAVPAPPVVVRTPVAVAVLGAPPSTSPFPAIQPSSVGRRASPLSWAGVMLGAAVFLAAALAVVAAAGAPAPGGAGSASDAPLARFDTTLYDGGTVSDRVPWDVEVEAVNPAPALTDRLWMIIEWAPDGAAGLPGMRGRFVACEPETCEAREDSAGRRTVVSWPGLPAGERRVLRTTVVATGLEPGIPLAYRVTTGSGPTETTMDGGNTWNLLLETE